MHKSLKSAVVLWLPDFLKCKLADVSVMHWSVAIVEQLEFFSSFPKLVNIDIRCGLVLEEIVENSSKIEENYKGHKSEVLKMERNWQCFAVEGY